MKHMLQKEAMCDIITSKSLEVKTDVSGEENFLDSRIFTAIDLKSFYASVECVDRDLNPLITNLVVADQSRTNKTICLAVSPSLKAYGISGRARLFEVEQKVAQINRERARQVPGISLSGGTYCDPVIRSDASLALDYIIAPPRMARYKKVSTDVYKVYLKYISPDDIVVYSIDEVFMDLTGYLDLYGMTARELTMTMVRDVLKTTGITATAGIGTNLFLCKVAMDVVAKHIPADSDGVRIAELDELSYRREIWPHEPITDIWRVGPGIAKKLADHGMYTMGDVARCSIGSPLAYYNEELLYELFGVNAEPLIDHAWGWEPCTIPDIKAYKPSTQSLGSGQVLQRPYDFDGGRLITREMTELLVLDLVDMELVTNQLTLTIGYDIENITDKARREAYHGAVVTDHYGRKVPRHAHGTENLPAYTSSTNELVDAAMRLYDRIVDPSLLIRRVNIVFCRVLPEEDAPKPQAEQQLDLFTDYASVEVKEQQAAAAREREKKRQLAMLSIQKKYGKNAILKGYNFVDGAMTRQRNEQVGGHRAGKEGELDAESEKK